MSRRPSLLTRRFRPRLDQLEGREVPATIVVTTLTDPLVLTTQPSVTFAADGKLVSLREAIESVNAGADRGDVTAAGAYGAGDTITFAPGLAGTALFNPGNPTSYTISRSVSVQGPGAAVLTVSGKDTTPSLPGQRRVFDIAAGAGTVGLSGLTVADGLVAGFGAGVRNTAATPAALTVSAVTFANNTAQEGAGVPAQPTSGGAIDSDGPLSVTGSTFTGNSASSAGGAIRAQGTGAVAAVSVFASTFAGNTAVAGPGGAIYSERQLDIASSTFTGNTAGGSGGAVLSFGPLTVASSTFATNRAGTGIDGGDGGAVDAVTGATVDSSTFDRNDAAGDGGGLALGGDVGSTYQVFNSTLTGNTAGGRGGGLFLAASTSGTQSVAVRSTTVVRNTAATGGGVANDLTGGGYGLRNVVVALNSAPTGPNLAGFYNSVGGSVFGDVAGATFSGGANGLTGVDPLLAAALAGNNSGGPQTLAPLPGSPVLGAGIIDTQLPTAVDQRLKPRPAAGPIDAGAFQAQRPTAAADGPFRVAFGTPLTLPAATLLANDQNLDVFTPLTAVLVGQPAAGTGAVVQNADGSFTYTPPAGYSGPASFTYQASDGVTRSAAVVVSLTVAAPVPPTAVADRYTVLPGTPTRIPAPGVLANDTAGSGPGPLAAALTTPPVSGTGSVALAADGSFTFTPAPGYSGLVRFSYTVSDGTATSAPATVDLTVSAPTGLTAAARPGYKLDLATATTLTVSAADGLLGGLSSPNGGTLRVASVTPGFGLPAATFAPGTGDFVVDRAAGSFALTLPADTPDGAYTFTYAVTDGLATSGPATATVTVSGGRVAATGLHFTAYGSGAGASAVVRVIRPLQSELVLRPFEASFQGGVRVALADLTGDGVDDVVVGAGPGGGPRVLVYDGAGSTTAAPVVLADFFAFNADFRGGAHVAAAATTAGGVPTSLLVVGAGSFADRPGSPRVVAFRGLTNVPKDGSVAASPAFSFNAYAPSFQGGVRVAVGDLKGTGALQIVTVPGPSGGPNVKVWDTAGSPGGTPALAQSFPGLASPDYRGGAFVAVSDGVVVVTPDSLPAFANTVLAANGGTLPDAAGAAPGGASAANTASPPAVRVFLSPLLLGRASTGFVDETVVAAPPLGDESFLGGIRPAIGRPAGSSERVVLFGYGPGRGGQVRTVRFTPEAVRAAGATNPNAVLATGSELAPARPLADLAGDPDASVYVALASAPLAIPRSSGGSGS